MIVYFSYLLLENIFPILFLQFTLYDGQLRTRFCFFFVMTRKVHLLTTDVIFSVLCELSQPMGKTFSMLHGCEAWIEIRLNGHCSASHNLPSDAKQGSRVPKRDPEFLHTF